MYTTQSGSYQPIDPNVQRILADTLTMVNDVDQRLTLLRQGIAHAFPQLAHIALARPGAGIGEVSGQIGAFGLLGPQVQGVPTPFQTPGVQGLPFQGVPFQGATLPGAPFQTLPFLGPAASPFLSARTPGFLPVGAPSPAGFFGQLGAGAFPGVQQAPFVPQPQQVQAGLPTGTTGVVGPTFRGY